MAHYIKSMVDELVQRIRSHQPEGVKSRFESVSLVLDLLDPDDFEPAYRYEFVRLRRLVAQYASLSESEMNALRQLLFPGNVSAVPVQHHRQVLSRLELIDSINLHVGGDQMLVPASFAMITNETCKRLEELSSVFDRYLGSDSRGAKREFPFIRNPGLRAIVERDYHDLDLRLFPMKTWKSVVILAGSILEALLHDLLTRDATRISDSMASTRAPRRPANAPPAGPRDLNSDAAEDQWMLNNYIEVADELRLLPADWKASVQVVLRDYRNYVHPRKELRTTDPITEGEAYQSFGALMKICDYIAKTHS